MCRPSIRKPERERTAAEQKIFDDYFPVLRIDPSKIKEIMPPEEVTKYNALLKKQRGSWPRARVCLRTGPWKKTKRS